MSQHPTPHRTSARRLALVTTFFLSACSTSSGEEADADLGTGASATAAGGDFGGVGGASTAGGSTGSDGGSGGSSEFTGGSSLAAGGGMATGGAAASGGGAGGDGGSDAGGSAAGGAPAGGGVSGDGGSGVGGDAAAGGSSDFAFILGADISGVEEKVGTTFEDTNGQTKDILDLLKNHGFNYIRLRTFVDPVAPYGYASTANGCAGKSEAYGDQAHVIAQGKRVKAANMGFLLDFHYSDVWADPGNQIVPEAWRNISTIEGLADQVKSYTKQYIEDAIVQGARPDMVQIGNEITPGMLVHVPGENTDCWGNSPSSHSPSGSSSNWDNLALLLRAGIAGVREVDPTIQIMLHTENTGDVASVRWWVQGARDRDVDFDVLGLSAYTAFQGSPATWRETFETIASEFPELSFVVAEYNPERTAANQIMLDLPDGRGLGTFFWEPTEGGEWGDAMFTWQGNSLVANPDDFAEYDQIKTLVGL